jgi:hypothetical protein
VEDIVFEDEKLGEGNLDVVTDGDAALDPDTDTDPDLLFVTEPDTDEEAALDPDTDADSDLLFVTDADSDLLFVFESDDDFDSLADNDGLLESVGSIDTDADTLRLTLDVCVSDGSTDAEAVSDGVKLGETGLIVTDGVIDGVGKNTV